jgi:hypothetical protein
MAPKPDTTADKFAMLLSTDWFTPYWALIGLDAGNHVCLQQGCREIVKQLIGSEENYYLISFADDRLSATRDAVTALGQVCKLSGQAAASIDAVCAPRRERDEEQTSAWMLTGVTLQTLTQDDELTPAIREILQRSREAFAFDSEVLGDSCKKSPTEWDAYIRQLTPELPCSLGDFVCVSLIPEMQLDFIFRQLDADQRKALLVRYKAVAVKITGLREAEVPDAWR